MNANTTKADTAFLWAAPAAPASGLSQTFGRFFRAMAERSRRRRVAAELNSLSDRELADIGIARGDIGHVLADR